MKTLVPSWTVDSITGSPAGPTKRLILVVGYDGSPPARHALDQAADLLSGREGALEVVFVAHPPAGATLYAAAMAEVREGLDEQSQALAAEVSDRLAGLNHPWHFQRRDGAVAAELRAVAADLHDRYDETAEIVIVVGASVRRYHHIAGSIGARVVRADVFPTLVVP